jgi:hypothetical protein
MITPAITIPYRITLTSKVNKYTLLFMKFDIAFEVMIPHHHDAGSKMIA